MPVPYIREEAQRREERAPPPARKWRGRWGVALCPSVPGSRHSLESLGPSTISPSALIRPHLLNSPAAHLLLTSRESWELPHPTCSASPILLPFSSLAPFSTKAASSSPSSSYAPPPPKPPPDSSSICSPGQGRWPLLGAPTWAQQ